MLYFALMYNFFYCFVGKSVFILKGSVYVYFTGISEGKSTQFVATDITEELWTAVPLTLLKSNSSQFMPFKAIMVIFIFIYIVCLFLPLQMTKHFSFHLFQSIISQTQDCWWV